MKKTTILLFAIAALGSGCKKFTNINQNPNQPTAVTPNVLLSAALVASGSSVAENFDGVGGYFSINTWMGYWSRSGSYIAVNTTEGYGIDQGYADGDFENLYATLNDYNNVETAADASPSTLAFYLGVAKTMKALHFGMLVDGFNNVPYSQAFNILKYPNPKYDDAQTIYTTLVNQCDSAVTYFNQAAAYYAAGPGQPVTLDDQYDVVFGRSAGGSSTSAAVTRMQKWIEFANTVKLRLLLHESSVSGQQAFIKSEIAKSLANGGFLPAGTSAAVNPGYSNSSAAQQNPFYGSFFNTGGSPQQNDAFWRGSKYATFYLKALKDTVRRALFYVPLSGLVDSVGANYTGDVNSVSNAYTSPVGPGLLKSSTQDQLFISDFESLFLQAEAVQLGYMTGSAPALVESALEQNFIYLGSTATAADAYYGVATTLYAGDPTKDPTTGLEGIITQKWMALNGIDWLEAYDDYRRTGFPVPRILSVSHAVQHVMHSGGVYIPFRFLYPTSEIDNNSSSVPAGVTQYTPVFWDTREGTLTGNINPF